MQAALKEIVQNKNTLMLITSLAFMTGILSYFNDIGILVSIIISILSVLIILFNFISPRLILIWVILFYAGFFNAFLRIAETDELQKIAPQETVIKGRIVSIPVDAYGGRKKFFFNVTGIDNGKYDAKTFVTLDTPENFDLKIGNMYEMKGKLRIPFISTNPSQFSYGNYLKNFKAYTTFYAKSSDCQKLQSKLSCKWKFLQRLNNLREDILSTHALFLKSPNLEILGGIVFGDDAVSTPDDIRTSFINAGILHILAASGMNVAFIYGFWCFFMRRFRLPFKISVLSGMGVIVLYTLMTGLGASVIRAALMLLFVLAGKLIDRDADSISLLAFVGMLMLVYNPAFINDVGFQLSFLATFGILMIGNVLFENTKEWKVLKVITGAVLIPVVAQVWVAPVQMFYFNTFCLYSIFANIAIMPFLSIVSFGGFVSSVFAIFMPVTKYLCMIIDWTVNIALNVIVSISHFVSELPNSILTTTHPNVIQIIFYYTIILFITLIFKIGWNKKIFYTIAATLLILLISMLHFPNHNLEIITFDVQNADAFLIKTPDNQYFIIDTGKFSFTSKNSQAKIIMIKYLADRGIKDIEGLILTHFDNDHAGGAEDIIKNLRVKHVYVNSYHSETETTANIFQTAKVLNIPTTIPDNGQNIFNASNLTLTAYISGITSNDNENSIITHLKYKDFDMLFMGDAGVQAFEIIKDKLPSNIEIFKAGHHGANGVVNRSMIEKLKSQVSVISTGTNPFGHPANGTLDVLRNTDIYRTDINHSIKIISDGNKYKLFTFNSNKKRYTFIKAYTAKP